jgi:hypothetical protein
LPVAIYSGLRPVLLFGLVKINDGYLFNYLSLFILFVVVVVVVGLG